MATDHLDGDHGGVAAEIPVVCAARAAHRRRGVSFDNVTAL
jgi:hypothetical protein